VCRVFVGWTQLADLQLIPEKSEKELSERSKQLDALRSDKTKEEQNLQEVMDSFKSETQVSISHLDGTVEDRV